MTYRTSHHLSSHPDDPGRWALSGRVDFNSIATNEISWRVVPERRHLDPAAGNLSDSSSTAPTLATPEQSTQTCAVAGPQHTTTHAISASDPTAHNESSTTRSYQDHVWRTRRSTQTLEPCVAVSSASRLHARIYLSSSCPARRFLRPAIIIFFSPPLRLSERKQLQLQLSKPVIVRDLDSL